MASDPIPLLVNPRAGRSRALDRLDPLRPILERIAIRIEVTQQKGDVECRARELSDAGVPRLLVAGGDGSVHEAVNGLLSSGTPAALGVLPLGTGNDFAKANAIPLHPPTAAELLVDRLTGDAMPRAVDVGRLNGRYFANGAGAGFDAQVSALAASMRWRIGQAVYFVALLRSLAAGVQTPELTVEADGETRAGRFTLVSFSIGPWVGGMFPIAPPASNIDGVLDLVTADALTRIGVLRLLPALLDGEHLGRDGVGHRRISHCRVVAEAPLPVHLDGEMQEPAAELNVDVLPAALHVL